jgi:hypothetical protein
VPDLPYAWNAKARRWQNASDGRKFIGPAKLAELRDKFVAGNQAKTAALVQRLAVGDVDRTGFEREMRAHLKSVFAAEYMLARGGEHMMTKSDWGKVGSLCRTQYQYLSDFCAEMGNGTLSLRAIQNRADLYIEAAVQAHERGKAAAWGVTLPAYPKDGSTICKIGCRCYWRIEEGDDEWRCTWVKTAHESCETCLQRAQEWNPLIIKKSDARTKTDLDARLNSLENAVLS